MKKVVTFESIIVSFISAIGYGAGFVIPTALGWNAIICIIICLVLGMAMDAAANKIIFSKAVQQSTKNKIIVLVCAAAIFAIGYWLMAKFFAYSLWNDVTMGLIFAVAIPIIAFVISMAVKIIKQLKLEKKYGSGESGFLLDDEIEEKWENLFGKNEEVKAEDVAKKNSGANLTVKTFGGTYVGKKDKSVVRFLGIPYAKAPVGENRWKKPVPVDASDRVTEAFYFGNSEIQPDGNHNILTRFAQSEDCLNLNIWTAKLEPDAKKPVFVYFHGGDGRYGGSANPVYHLENLAKSIPDAICVSINYRFGLFGVVDFSFTDCADKDEYKGSTALSLFDQIEALKWIKKNISAFGGDPENITVAGDNAGGSCICLLSTMKEAKGLFKRAMILCASTCDSPLDTDKSSEVGRLLLEEFGAKSVGELASVTSEQLRDFTNRHYDLVELVPRDGEIIPQDIEKAILEGGASDVEFIFGIAADDVSGWQAMLAGDVSLDDMVKLYYERIKEDIGSEKSVKLDELLNKCVQSGMSEAEAKKMLLGDFYYKSCVLHDCNMWEKSGNRVRCFYWDVTGNIEKLAANSVSLVTTLLGNAKIAEQMGYLNYKDVTLVLQSFLGRFISGGTMAFYNNEIKGVEEIDWKEFAGIKTFVLHVNESAIEISDDLFSDNVWELEQLVFEQG